MQIIQAKNISKVYGSGEAKTTALKSVSLSVEKGEFLAVMGASGSGKSTLLHILGFLDRPTDGEYLFKGKSMSELTDSELAYVRNKEMGFVFQSFNLLPRIDVFENVKLPLYYTKIKEVEKNKLVQKALKAAGIAHRASYKPNQLSGGEQQRVAIARAIVNEPTVIFADEPTGNLDSKSGEVVMEAIQALNERGHTIILVTHETITARYAERVIVMKDGKIQKDQKITQRLFIEKDKFLK